MSGPISDFAVFGWADLPVTGGPIGKVPGLLIGDVVLIVMSSLGVLLLLMFWAKFIRNRKRKKKESDARRVYRRSEESSREAEELAESEASGESEAEQRRRFKYRWKRRTYRRRNPTLAETGGLPPARPDSEPESP